MMQVEENLERWSYALERRGMKVKNTCVNETETVGKEKTESRSSDSEGR